MVVSWNGELEEFLKASGQSPDSLSSWPGKTRLISDAPSWARPLLFFYVVLFRADLSTVL